MPYIDGLPAASAVNLTDLIIVDQGYTGVPGSSTTRSALVSQFVGGSGIYMQLTGGTFTGNVAHGAFQLSGSNVSFTGGTINATVIGGITPAAGSFTTLSATGLVSGAGFTAWAASPPAIGGTAPASGAFTTLSASTLSASGLVSGAGFTAWAASPPPIGGTAAAAGAFTTLSATGTITPAQVAGIVGTTTNNDAQAGSVGEYLTANATSVSVTTATPTNITSVSLTAGDWDVWGSIQFVPAGTTTVTQIQSAINTTSATLPASNAAAGGGWASLNASLSTGIGQQQPTGTRRISIASTTTVYLVGQSTFGVSTMTANGVIAARRVR
jgi:hypothetical protein